MKVDATCHQIGSLLPQARKVNMIARIVGSTPHLLGNTNFLLVVASCETHSGRHDESTAARPSVWILRIRVRGCVSLSLGCDEDSVACLL